MCKLLQLLDKSEMLKNSRARMKRVKLIKIQMASIKRKKTLQKKSLAPDRRCTSISSFIHFFPSILCLGFILICWSVVKNKIPLTKSEVNESANEGETSILNGTEDSSLGMNTGSFLL